jgi:excisionase family DNA binding protein
MIFIVGLCVFFCAFTPRLKTETTQFFILPRQEECINKTYKGYAYMNKYKITDAIGAPAEIINAAVSMLKSFYPDLTVGRLIECLEGLGRTNDDEELFTRAEIARKTKLSIPSIDRLLASDQLEYIRIRRSVRIPASALNRLLAQGKHGCQTLPAKDQEVGHD